MNQYTWRSTTARNSIKVNGLVLSFWSRKWKRKIFDVYYREDEGESERIRSLITLSVTHTEFSLSLSPDHPASASQNKWSRPLPSWESVEKLPCSMFLPFHSLLSSFLPQKTNLRLLPLSVVLCSPPSSHTSRCTEYIDVTWEEAQTKKPKPISRFPHMNIFVPFALSVLFVRRHVGFEAAAASSSSLNKQQQKKQKLFFS